MSLIEQIHAAPLQVVLAITGGGSGAIARLLDMPGASRTVLEATVPYSAAALADYLGAAPEAACDERTARVLAMAAYQRAGRFAPTAPRLAGIGATASLASDRSKRGAHRIHVAVQTADATRVASLILEKNARSRAEEERLCADLILNEIALAARLEQQLQLALRVGEQIAVAEAAAEPAWKQLLSAAREMVDAGPGQSPRGALFPGAFNPPHAGHADIVRVAAEILGQPVAYELSIANADKPLLDFLEIRRRCEALSGKPLWLTRAATFVEKSRLFLGAVFVVGVDTLARIADPKYYGADPDRADAAFDAIAERGCSFLVFGRRIGETFCTLSDLDLPARLRTLCSEVPEKTFRRDVSSTELRAGEQ